MKTLRCNCPIALLAFVCLSPQSSAWGQGLSDPTRPAIVPPGKTATLSPEDASTVYLLLTSPTRKYAFVGGELLAQGQTGSQGKLLEIRANEVVIETENGRETLSLFPGVVKSPAKPLPNGAKARSVIINNGNNK